MFHNCTDEKQVSDLYRTLAKYLHPDKGGESNLFVLLGESKEKKLSMLKSFEKPKEDEKPKKEQEKPKEKFTPPENGKYQPKEENITLKEHQETCKIILDILEYAKGNKGFDTNFTRSVQLYLSSKGYITVNQYNILLKIYYRFNIGEWIPPEKPKPVKKKAQKKKKRNKQ